MAEKYFKNFPIITYGDNQIRNIILKAKFARELLNAYDNFYPYTVKLNESITQVSYDYYGSIDYVWLIMASNEMIDPYYDWPLGDEQFEGFIISKYGSTEAAQNISNAQWYRNSNFSYWMTKTTYNNISASERTGWNAIDNYTYELVLNEEKRRIRMLDRTLALDAANELEKLFKKANI